METTVPVSVIIPCFNSGKVLERAVDSVIEQTNLPFEIILVNDASTDDTSQKIEEIKRKYSWFRIISIDNNQNRGAGFSRNTGWNKASADYLAFLDADDIWFPEKLEIQYGWMKKHPEYGLTGHSCPYRTDVKSIIPKTAGHDLKFTRLTKTQILMSNRFSTPTAMLKRKLPYRFESEKRFAEDYQLWMNIIIDNVPTAYIDAPLAAILKPAYGSGGLSKHLWHMEKGELGAYWNLHRGQKIGYSYAVLLTVYSLLKYFRRVIITSLKQI